MMEFDSEYKLVIEANYFLPSSGDENGEITIDTSRNTDFLEVRDIEKHQDLEVEKFYTSDCCESKCNKKIPMEEAIKQRLNFMELDKAEQDVVILSHLQSCRSLLSLKNEYVCKKRKKTDEKSSRQSHQYLFSGLLICRDTFLFLHDMGIKRYKNLINYYNENGLSPREHKSKNKLSTRNNVLSAVDIENVVQFLKAYASKVAVPLPGRLPQFRNFEKIIKLPFCDTKSAMYRKFVDAASKDENIRIVAHSSSFNIWKMYCPEIMTMKPASDLCSTCRENNLKLANLSNVTTEEQVTLLDIARLHLDNAKNQPEFYNLQREIAKKETLSSLLVISFDYAQNVSYPSSPQQVGTSYFKANRKCGLFGINNEATHVQVNIAIDGEDNVGKGANTVISMLHYFLNNNVADNLVLFADNCTGQNKNNALLHYLLWRMLKKMNKSIELNFLLIGHTKFSPDRNFGIIKSKFAKSCVDCLEDFLEVIKTSSPNNFNIAVPSKDPKTKIHNVVWAQWDQYLQQFFKPILNLTKFHHFCFKEDGSIKAKLFVNSEVEEIRKATPLSEEVMPLKIIEAEGISEQRALYLFKEIPGITVPFILKKGEKGNFFSEKGDKKGTKNMPHNKLKYVKNHINNILILEFLTFLDSLVENTK